MSSSLSAKQKACFAYRSSDHQRAPTDARRPRCVCSRGAPGSWCRRHSPRNEKHASLIAPPTTSGRLPTLADPVASARAAPRKLVSSSLSAKRKACFAYRSSDHQRAPTDARRPRCVCSRGAPGSWCRRHSPRNEKHASLIAPPTTSGRLPTLADPVASARAAPREAGVVVTLRETKSMLRLSLLRPPAGAYRRSQTITVR